MNFNIIAIAALLSVVSAPAADAQSKGYVENVDSAAWYADHERWADSERCLKQALRLEPAYAGNALVLSNLGYAQTRLGHLDEALVSYGASLGINPESARVLTNRAATYIDKGDTRSALADLDKALNIDPNLKDALRVRGVLRLDKGDTTGAEADFTALAKIAPADASAFSGLASCAAMKGDLKEAVKWYDEAIKISPDEDMMFMRGLYLLETDDFKGASEAIAEALAKYPQCGNLYLLRGVLHQRAYLNTEAEADKKLALRYGADPEIFEQLFPAK